MKCVLYKKLIGSLRLDVQENSYFMLSYKGSCQATFRLNTMSVAHGIKVRTTNGFSFYNFKLKYNILPFPFCSFPHSSPQIMFFWPFLYAIPPLLQIPHFQQTRVIPFEPLIPLLPTLHLALQCNFRLVPP